jgi:ABC-type antimicrobial peptide transport system permease subunit
MTGGGGSRIVALSVLARNILGEALASLKGRRLQAALSSFGIATGIASVVLLVSIVSGIHRYAVEQFGAVGGNVIQVSAGQQRSTRDPRGFPLTLRVEDMDAVLSAVDHYDLGMAENSASGIVRTPRRASQGIQVRGITERGFELLGLRTERGRLFLQSEYAVGSRVAVLGAALAADLFVQESPVGQTIFIGDWPFQVVGVLEWVGDPVALAPAGPDSGLFVPFKACAAAFRGNEQASVVRLRLTSVDTGTAAIAETQAVLEPLRRRRGETSGEFQVVNTIDRIRELTLVLTGLKLAVGLVGSIGLFVGAVGVANVLLVSIRERRAEIGVRRAVGATRGAIFAGFLIEALVMTLSGGIVGIAAAWALTKIAILFPQVPADARPHISLVTALTALTLLTLVGLVSGVWPAKRAAAVFPAEALRAE